MSFDISKPALLVGNGPSCVDVQYDRIPPQILVFRMNMFFLEKHFFFGRSVAGFFCSVRNSVIENYLEYNLEHREYEIEKYFTPFKREYQQDVLGKGQSIVDHWELLSRVPDVALEMMKRPLPTQGLQALATLLTLGFREIYVAGIDFYQGSSNNRYFYQIPEFIKKEMPQKDYQLGYEQGAHSFEKDLYFYEIIKECFPSGKIFSVCERSYFTKLAPMPKVLGKGNNLFLEKKIQSYTWIQDDDKGITWVIKRLVAISIKYLRNLPFLRKCASWIKTHT